MIPCCGYPECTDGGVITFALVPLCIDHYLKIVHETEVYYSGGIDRYADRKHYHRISDKIPWRNHSLKIQRAGRKNS